MGPSQVTIFGASGFIGRHVVSRFAAQGWRVVAAVRDPERASFLKPMGDVGQVAPLGCDIRNPSLVARALEGSTVAVNLVGILYETRRNRFADLHGAGPGIIAAAGAAAGIKSFVHVSAIGADADSSAGYAQTKAAGEQAARAGFANTVTLRPSLVFGPEDDFFNRFAALARLVPALPLFGGGHNKFQPVYVGDVADAVFDAAVKPAHKGQTYELGGPHVYTFKELMELVLTVTERRRGLLPLPMVLADLIGRFGDIGAWFGLPPLLTRDQAQLLRRDNIATGPGFDAFAIRPTAAEAVLPSYLDRFRRTGRFRTSRL
jgi:NADH dehydrogenase